MREILFRAKSCQQKAEKSETKPKTKLIYVCSVYRGFPPYSINQSKRNLAEAAVYCRQIIEEGNVPIAPHLFYQAVLDNMDETSRQTGLKLAAALIAKCDEMRVFGRELSEGMKADIAVAERLGISVKRV